MKNVKIDLVHLEQFSGYSLNVKQLNQIHLCSSNAVSGKQADDENNKSSIIFLADDSFTNVAAGSKSIDTVWFMKVIVDDCLSDSSCVDDYENAVGQGVIFERSLFRKNDEEDDHKLYIQTCEKKPFFYKESLVYIPIFQYPRDKESLCLEQL